MAGKAAQLAPVRGRERIDVLDIARGLAILGIYYLNIAFQAYPATMMFLGPWHVGWTPGDQAAYAFTNIFLEGTQRCLLEFLFGAGMMVLTAKAMEPDGPVAVADLYFRRTLWLAAFGLFDIFVWLWTGDILFIYALAAMPLFVFRQLGPKTLVALGLIYTVYAGAFGLPEYIERTQLVARVDTATAHQKAGVPLTSDDKAAVTEWKGLQASVTTVPPGTDKKLAEEKQRHTSVVGYYRNYWQLWSLIFVQQSYLFEIVFEAFCAMLIGIALWKWGVIQGLRSARFYAVLMVAGYAVGITIRATSIIPMMQFSFAPKPIWFLAEPARLAVGLGHLALINLLVKWRFGRTILSPFKAAGRTAFSLYFLEQLIGVHILFAPYGFNLWGRFGWAGQFWIATGVFVTCLIVANIWTRFFAMGPLEWAWRSLSYLRRQPFRIQRGA
ncbi:MAG: DUF418 domain-containing protein [Sphingomonas sp.]|uniref:DUF418 domain-containing protein n=1 Tax=Sphingomonas sp. TaxID=28214 RepID=UPI0011F85532|nr:DUF418 domain-containing protein [Sphingomonas sp.]THD35758.1 MAG: DUF418 domain-containing protein [Sphingomonas sp.]